MRSEALCEQITSGDVSGCVAFWFVKSPFSNVMDRAIIFRASDRSRKKVKFREIFRDKFAKKSANFTGILGANFAEKHAQSVKNGGFCGYFQGKFARNRSALR